MPLEDQPLGRNGRTPRSAITSRSSGGQWSSSACSGPPRRGGGKRSIRFTCRFRATTSWVGAASPPIARKAAAHAIKLRASDTRHDFPPTDSWGDDFWETGSGNRKPRFAGLSWAGQDSNLRSSDYELRVRRGGLVPLGAHFVPGGPLSSSEFPAVREILRETFLLRRRLCFCPATAFHPTIGSRKPDYLKHRFAWKMGVSG